MKKILLVLIAMFLFSNTCFAVDLDAPTEKKVTIKSEIKRGHDAISLLSSTGGNLSAYAGKVFDVISYNKQKNTDTDAFYLGAYLAAWRNMDIMLDVYKDYYTKRDLEYGNSTAKFFLKEFRDRQKQMEIDDQTLCTIALLKYEYIKEKIEKWEK